MKFSRLLAKSDSENVSTTNSSTLLPGHLKDVYQSADSIFHRTGTAMLNAVGLSVAVWEQRFKHTLLLAAALHDLGKANNHFQPMVHGAAEPEDRQPLRHEWVSIWIAMQPRVKQWLMPAVGGCEGCFYVTVCAIAGHHRKSLPEIDGFGNQRIEVYASHQDFQACLRDYQRWFSLDAEIPEIESTVHGGSGDAAGKTEFRKLVKQLRKKPSEIKRDEEWGKFCAVVKATLIAADVAGSALWEHIDKPLDRQEWIESSLGRTPSKANLNGIVNARLGGHSPRDFQEGVASSADSVTLVEAGCGGGKTLAAYMWAAKQHAGRRIWFCYPTTGTATEGFRDYLFEKLPDGSGVRTDLFHSRSSVDIRSLTNGDRKFEMDELIDATVRVDSLKAWDTQIVACTVDNVLSLLQNQRSGLYAWPALANSAIVFDEVHCYDNKLFGNLLTWLETLVGIPVLLMTASLPNARREAIREACQVASRSFKHIPNGQRDLEELPRYENQTGVATTEEAINAVCIELENQDAKGRVLWISNTVQRARDVGDHFDDLKPIYYHSRFVYKDRMQQHESTLKLFESEDAAGFASTSQVAEMSLDLGYATLLVTELAPIPALIQRLGRLNRRATPEANPPVIRNFIVIEPLKDGEVLAAPYDDEELELARLWIAKLADGPVSQLDLVEKWHELDQSEEILPEPSHWLNGGITTTVDSIRDGSYGITVIRNCDLAAARKEGAAAYALPMDRPKRESWKASQYPFRGMPVASDEAIDYDFHHPNSPKKGATWATFNLF
jgi:CRISPR-associated endonuclease/helicase Cas3